MESVLVTGGCGFIGSHFIRHLLESDSSRRVINLDLLTYAGNQENLSDVEGDSRYRFVRGNVCDVGLVEQLTKKIDAVVHLAAETHVDRSIRDPHSFIDTDIIGTYTLLEAARKRGIRRFVYVSTDEVYGEAPGIGPGSREVDPLQPRSPYAASKAGADCLAFSYWATFGLPVVIGRCSNNFGPNQYPEKMIPLFITNALEDKHLPVYGDGQNIRDWIYVEDHCRALHLLLESSDIEGEIFNIGGGTEKTTLDMARAILKCLGLSEEYIQLVQDRPGHVRRHAVETRKIRDVLSFEPEDDFDSALVRTISWYQENRSWWGKIKSGEFRKYYQEIYGEKSVHPGTKA